MDQSFKSAMEASGLLLHQFEVLHTAFGSQADYVQTDGRLAGSPYNLVQMACLGFPCLQALHVHAFQFVLLMA
jgi:hypothetical protein